MKSHSVKVGVALFFGLQSALAQVPAPKDYQGYVPAGYGDQSGGLLLTTPNGDQAASHANEIFNLMGLSSGFSLLNNSARNGIGTDSNFDALVPETLSQQALRVMSTDDLRQTLGIKEIEPRLGKPETYSYFAGYMPFAYWRKIPRTEVGTDGLKRSFGAVAPIFGDNVRRVGPGVSCELSRRKIARDGIASQLRKRYPLKQPETGTLSQIQRLEWLYESVLPVAMTGDLKLDSRPNLYQTPVSEWNLQSEARYRILMPMIGQLVSKVDSARSINPNDYTFVPLDIDLTQDGNQPIVSAPLVFDRITLGEYLATENSGRGETLPVIQIEKRKKYYRQDEMELEFSFGNLAQPNPNSCDPAEVDFSRSEDGIVLHGKVAVDPKDTSFAANLMRDSAIKVDLKIKRLALKLRRTKYEKMKKAGIPVNWDVRMRTAAPFDEIKAIPERTEMTIRIEFEPMKIYKLMYLVNNTVPVLGQLIGLGSVCYDTDTNKVIPMGAVALFESSKHQRCYIEYSTSRDKLNRPTLWGMSAKTQKASALDWLANMIAASQGRKQLAVGVEGNIPMMMAGFDKAAADGMNAVMNKINGARDQLQELWETLPEETRNLLMKEN